jgi:hypothetical protein
MPSTYHRRISESPPCLSVVPNGILVDPILSEALSSAPMSSHHLRVASHSDACLPSITAGPFLFGIWHFVRRPSMRPLLPRAHHLCAGHLLAIRPNPLSSVSLQTSINHCRLNDNSFLIRPPCPGLLSQRLSYMSHVSSDHHRCAITLHPLSTHRF